MDCDENSRSGADLKTQSFYVRQIQASIDNLKETVDDAMDYFSKVYGEMGESTYLELKVVLNELLINAIKHGSKEDVAKQVKLVAGLTDGECALLVVEDDGDGYDVNLLEQCRKIGRNINVSGSEQDDINSINESGRGIFIVKSLCEDFMVNEKGNKIVVNKKLSHD